MGSPRGYPGSLVLNISDFFKLNQIHTRGHKFKII